MIAQACAFQAGFNAFLIVMIIHKNRFRANRPKSYTTPYCICIFGNVEQFTSDEKGL